MEVAHLHFSVEYFSTVLRMFYTVKGAGRERSECVVKFIIGLAYAVCYLLLVAYYLCQTFAKKKTKFFYNYLLDSCTCLSGGLLLVAICLFRRKVKERLANSGYYMQERIMMMHTYLFTAYMILSISGSATRTIAYENEELSLCNQIDCVSS